MKLLKIFTIVFLFLIVCLIGIFYVIPMIQDSKDKSDLENIFTEIPKFSSTGSCDNIRLIPRNRMMGTEAAVGCSYIPIYDFNTTTQKYDNYLKDSQWSFKDKSQNGENFYYEKGCYSFAITIPSRIRSSTINEDGSIIKDIQKENPIIKISLGKDNC